MSRHAALISFRGYRLLSTTSKFHSKGLHGITDHHVEATQTFYHNQLEIIRTNPTQMQPKPTDMNGLKFGHHFTDHMFEADWSHDNGWTKPVIMPFRSFTLHPAAKVLHYAAELFEGMKAFRGVDSRIRLFRPEKNMARMRRTAARASLPDFDPDEFLKIICELVKLENEWVPYSDTASLYIRPALIATEPTLGVGHPHQAKIFVICSPVASFYQTGSCEPVALLADPTFVRSFPGGVGSYKLGCNYAPTILIGKLAADYGCHQVLWLSGPEHKLTEVGAMNIFVYWKNKQGELELVTPPLCDGMILPGIIRDTVLTLAREWKEFRISERYPTMDELIQALAEGRLLQMFGSGTACAVTPIDQIVYRDEEKNRVEHLEIPTMKSGADVMQRLYQTITDIQHGRLDRPEWVHVIDC